MNHTHLFSRGSVLLGGSRDLISGQVVQAFVGQALKAGLVIRAGCAVGADALIIQAVLSAGAAESLSVFAAFPGFGSKVPKASDQAGVLAAARAGAQVFFSSFCASPGPCWLLALALPWWALGSGSGFFAFRCCAWRFLRFAFRRLRCSPGHSGFCCFLRFRSCASCSPGLCRFLGSVSSCGAFRFGGGCLRSSALSDFFSKSGSEK